jgi:alpha-L-arabinofuranosidase
MMITFENTINRKHIFFTLFVLVSIFSQSFCAEKKTNRVVVETKVEISNVERKPGGLLTCFLLDSDKKRPRKISMVETYKKMGVQSVRFPFGALANNYLWTTPPYKITSKGLTPRVAAKSKPPAKFIWATNPDGSFKKDLDFDEFIKQCRDANIEPVIVINVMSHKYDGGPELKDLHTSAVEWVRYSNITKKYGVKYWQLGNEQDHHSKLMSQKEYEQIYGSFAKAMKSIDPSIKTGVAVIKNKNWVNGILKNHRDSVDFVGCHQYQWKNWTIEKWQKVNQPLIPNILGISNILNKPGLSNIEIMVTEMSSFGKWYDGKGLADMTRSLCFAEMLLHASTIKQVAYTHFWTTHNAWLGENSDGELCSALNADNSLKPTAEIIGIVNNHLDELMVRVPRVSRNLRIFASCTKNRKVVTLFIINKENKAVEFNCLLKDFTPKRVVKRLSYAGKSFSDLNPIISVDKKALIEGSNVSLMLEGASLTVLKLSSEKI